MNSSKKFIALLCAFSFGMCAFLSAQDAALTASGEDSVQTAVQNRIDESQYSLEGTSAQPSGGSGRSSGGFSTVWIFFRMILVLAIVLAVIWIIFKLMKRSSDPEKSSDEFLRKVSSLTISPGKSVQIVTLIDKAYLLGVSDSSVNLLTEIDDPELIQAMNLYADKNSRTDRPKSFEDVLELFMPKKKKAEVKATGKGSAFEDGASRQILDSLKKQTRRMEGGE